MGLSIRWLLLVHVLVRSAHSVVVCGPGFTCPDGNTCCPRSPLTGDGAGWACCADEEPGKGACCGDGRHCCANGYTCELSSSTCVADEPKLHPLATRTNLYSLCPADIPASPHEFTGLVSSSPLSLPYYSSPGPLGEPNGEAQLAVIVVHGSDRNADDYFCSMQEARDLQTSWDPAHIIVVAPRFTEPSDHPSPGWFTWNGTDYGDWRKGGNSTLGGRASLSSYAVLDKMIALLSDKHLYPNLRQLVVTGHSAGGQTVQRYALVTRSAPSAPPGSPKLRFVVANPSSFGYLNASRWENTSRPTVLTLPDPSQCPDYNAWHYGFGARFTPFVANSIVAHGGERPMFDAYAARDVIYLMGQNDTCNEYLTPHCQSHGLDKSCAGMLEGHFRRERAEDYIKFLAAFFARPVHTGSLVPGVGHDHTNMFQSVEGLAALFSPDGGKRHENSMPMAERQNR